MKDYQVLLNDSEFLLILQKPMYNRAQKILIVKHLVEDIEELEQLIEVELKEM